MQYSDLQYFLQFFGFKGLQGIRRIKSNFQGLQYVDIFQVQFLEPIIMP